MITITAMLMKMIMIIMLMIIIIITLKYQRYSKIGSRTLSQWKSLVSTAELNPHLHHFL